MTGALELVFTRLPIGGASQVGATCVDDEQSLRVANDPDSIVLLKFGINAKTKIGGILAGADPGN